MPDADKPPFVTTRTAARMLCVSSRQITKYIECGALHACQWTGHGHYRIPREEIEAFIARARRRSEKDAAVRQELHRKGNPPAC